MIDITKRVLLCIFFAVFFISTVQAQENNNSLQAVYLPSKKASAVLVNGQVVFYLYQENSTDPQKKAQLVVNNLIIAKKKGFLPTKLSVKAEKKNVLIMAGPLLIVSVTPYQAKMNNTTVKELASAWLFRLKKVFSVKILQVYPSSLVIPLGKTANIKVVENLEGKIEFSSPNNDYFSLTHIQNNTWEIKGLKPGKTQLIIEKGGLKTALSMSVKEYAALIPPTIKGFVTGNPVPPPLLKEKITETVKDNIELKPGATLTILEDKILEPAPLSLDKELVIKVPVRIISPNKDYISFEDTIKVTIKNISLPLQKAAFLLVSNRPEVVKENGILFREMLANQNPLRLLYFHKSDPFGRNRIVVVRIINKEDKPAKVFITKGTAGPSKDEIFVGHESTKRFLYYYNSSAASLTDVPPKTSLVLVQQEMPADFLVSGIIQFQLQEGPSVEIIIQVRENWLLNNTITSNVDVPYNPYMIHPKGVFSQPTVQINKTYLIDEEKNEPQIFTLGGAPWFKDINTGHLNKGNYGIIYDINLLVENKNRTTKLLEIYFQPVRGVARGTFLFGEQLIETNLVFPGQLELLKITSIGPREKRLLRIQSTPEGGSYYPVQLVVKSK